MNKRRIVCAACKIKREGFATFIGADIVLSIRHFDPMMLDTISRMSTFPESINGENSIQGFIDNTGNFLDRKEAFKVAKAAGQILEKTGAKDSEELYSEDLY